MLRDVPCRWLPLCLVAVAATVGAEEAPLVVAVPAAFHGVHVPLSVMSRTRHADLRDLRVLNARGDTVPFAWSDEPDTVETTETRQTLRFFKAPAAASAAADGGRGGWIIDARPVKGAMMNLTLAPPEGSRGIHGFALEYSDDLQRWSVHTADAQRVLLEQGGERLQHTEFELGGLRARFLRLRPLAGYGAMPLGTVSVTSVRRHRAAAPVEWSEALTPAACTATACDYALPRHLPLERLSWQLSSAPILAPVTLSAQYGAEPSGVVPGRRKRDRLRDTLSGVRQKEEPTATTREAAWVPLQQVTLYRLPGPQGETQTPEMVLNAGQVVRLRIEPKGGMAQLGSAPPTLKVGTRPASLVFLAREPAPFRLAWGDDQPTGVVELSQLMPTRQPGDPLPSGTATLPPGWTSPPASSPPLAAPASVPARNAVAPTPMRKFWLWGVLLAAVGLMGVMAWSLLRPKATPPPAS